MALGATALLYNPILPIHLTRQIWSVLNLATAGLFISHLWTLRRLVVESPPAYSDSGHGLTEFSSSSASARSAATSRGIFFLSNSRAALLVSWLPLSSVCCAASDTATASLPTSKSEVLGIIEAMPPNLAGSPHLHTDLAGCRP